MTNITKLPHIFKGKSCGGDSYDVGMECAKLLEAALPKWIKISDDIIGVRPGLWALKNTLGEWIIETHYWPAATHYRPLCDLDHPPENRKDISPK